VLQGVPTVWDTDVFRPLIAAAEAATSTAYGTFPGTAADVSLRILAEHGRTMTFLVADGVVPSNEERGYVLRRIIRRAVRHAFLLGANDTVTPALVDATVAVMGDAYPDLVKSHELIATTVGREEERFRQTLERGVDLLDELLAKGDVSGEDAFFLHDTLGFPIDLTREIAEERERTVDLDGFQSRMQQQRTRAQDAHKSAGGKSTAPLEVYRQVVDEHGPTEFTGRQEYVTTGATVQALVADGARASAVSTGVADVILDRTPFYAESGGQTGDTGAITTASGCELRVVDTQYGLPDLVVHRCEVVTGEVAEGDEVTASIDAERRDAIRRNHTATHVLHWALREVLGSHVQQAGSLVAPDRLRFDFSHFEAVTPEELARVEALANHEVITDAPVRHYETTKEHAEQLGAIAFFGDKYGDLVRVLEAGEHSIELCGGTHVHALGFIGPIKIVSEGSIGANLRRIEALTGDGALEHISEGESTLRSTASLLKVEPEELPVRVERLLGELKEMRALLDAERARQAVAEAGVLAASAVDGVVVERRDGLAPDLLRQLALATRDALGAGIVGLVGVGPDGDKASVVVAVTKGLVEAGVSAGAIAADAAQALGGGTGKQADLAMGGGTTVNGIEDAQALLVQRPKEAAGGSPAAG
jgi:alanyl-tRNA synthetase